MHPLRLSLLRSHAGGLIGVGRNRLYPKLARLYPGLTGLYPGLAGYESLTWWILGWSVWYRLGLDIGIILEGRFNPATKGIFERAIR